MYEGLKQEGQSEIWVGEVGRRKKGREGRRADKNGEAWTNRFKVKELMYRYWSEKIV